MRSSSLKTQLRLQFIVLLWGFSGVIGKGITLSALPIAWYRMLFAMIILGLIILFTKLRFTVTKKQLMKYILTGMVIGSHWMAFFGAIKLSNVAIALSTLSTCALFSALLEPLFFKRKVRYTELILAIIVSGCILLIYNVKPQYWEGLLLGLLCSALSATFSILNSTFEGEAPASRIMFYEMLGGFGLISLVVLFHGGLQAEITGVDFQNFSLLIILGAIITAFPMVESVKLMKYISPFTLLLNINFEPVYGIILARLIYGESEKMNVLFYLATVIMIAVVMTNQIVQRKRQKKEKVFS